MLADSLFLQHTKKDKKNKETKSARRKRNTATKHLVKSERGIGYVYSKMSLTKQILVRENIFISHHCFVLCFSDIPYVMNSNVFF